MKKIIIFMLLVAIVVFILCVFMKYVFLSELFYKKNVSLDEHTNNGIEVLLLTTIKDRHSVLFSVDKNSIYTEAYQLEINKYKNTFTSKSMFIIVDTDFMKSVRIIDDNKYLAEIQLKWPEDWRYYITICEINNQFLVSNIELDP